MIYITGDIRGETLRISPFINMAKNGSTQMPRDLYSVKVLVIR